MVPNVKWTGLTIRIQLPLKRIDSSPQTLSPYGLQKTGKTGVGELWNLAGLSSPATEDHAGECHSHLVFPKGVERPKGSSRQLHGWMKNNSVCRPTTYERDMLRGENWNLQRID